MIQLSSTTRKLQLVTGSAGNIGAYAAWIDLSGTTITPGEDFSNISTATSTDIVAAPAASTSRRIKFLNIENASSSVSNVITINIVDGGTTVPIFSTQLLPGENLVLDGEGSWHHHDVNGADYSSSIPISSTLGPSGVIAESIPRQLCTETNTSALTSGTLYLQAIYLWAGQTVSNITIWSATTAAGTPTQGFFALYDSGRNLLAQSANFTNEAWASQSAKTKAMTTPYRVTATGLYYVGIVIVATTVPTLKGNTAITGGQLHGAGLSLHGNSSTGITTSLPSPAAAITAGTTSIYAAIS